MWSQCVCVCMRGGAIGGQAKADSLLCRHRRIYSDPDRPHSVRGQEHKPDLTSDIKSYWTHPWRMLTLELILSHIRSKVGKDSAPRRGEKKPRRRVRGYAQKAKICAIVVV